MSSEAKTQLLSIYVLVFLSIAAVAQTKFITDTNIITSTTNGVTTSQNQIHLAQLKSVFQTLQRYYTIEVSADKSWTIQDINAPLSDDIIESDGDDYMKIGLLCVVVPPEIVPSGILLRITSHSKTQQFLDGHEYPIEFDGKSITPRINSNNNSIGDMKSNTSNTESLYEEVSVEQFQQLAWADHVWIKTADQTCEVPYSVRQKWKLLWKYFDLINAYQNDKLKKAQNDTATNQSDKASP